MNSVPMHNSFSLVGLLNRPIRKKEEYAMIVKHVMNEVMTL